MTFNSIDQHPRRHSLRARFAAVALAVILGLGIVTLVRGPSRSAANEAVPVAPTPRATGEPDPAPTVPVYLPDPLVLPKPERMAGTVPVGYPHTASGAVAAATYFTEALDLLDPTVAADQARVMAVPQDAASLADQAGAGARQLRIQAGLPADGPTMGSFISYQVRGYQLGPVATNHILVWVLTVQSASVSGGPIRSTNTVLGLVLDWTGTDWRVTKEDPGALPPASQPGSDQAHTDGWRDLAESTS